MERADDLEVVWQGHTTKDFAEGHGEDTLSRRLDARREFKENDSPCASVKPIGCPVLVVIVDEADQKAFIDEGILQLAAAIEPKRVCSNMGSLGPSGKEDSNQVVTRSTSCL